MARTAVTACGIVAKLTLAEARKCGRSCSRIQARVMNPRVPSEPITIRSGEGPAPEPGRRRLSIAPLGVSIRRLSTKSSICV